MDGPTIEPRKVMWAVAEVSWDGPGGAPLRERATIEDMSLSGACLRLRLPVQIGSRLMVKWHREQFAAVARNCRSDGGDFLLGVRRDHTPLAEKPTSSKAEQPSPKPNDQPAKAEKALAASAVIPSRSSHVKKTEPAVSDASNMAASASLTRPEKAVEEIQRPASQHSEAPRALVQEKPAPSGAKAAPPGSTSIGKNSVYPAPKSSTASQSSSSPRERNIMQPKNLLPNFWRRQPDGDALAKTTLEVPVNNPKESAAEAAAPRTELLSYEDIYHAAGILAPRSGYGVHKVVEMLKSDRIRELAPEVKRASVLMALDAAGASAEELLQDARQRQQALDTYEERQRKQLEEFEARKAAENTQIQAEMERVTAHYAQRIQRNRDAIAQEKEVLRNWQMAKQNESQRIGEVIELCSNKPAANAAMGAAAGAQGAEGARSGNLRPTLLPDVSGRN